MTRQCPKVLRYEGYWKASEEEDSDFPWPTSQPEWAGRNRFLSALTNIESNAERIVYRGFSRCRLCGSANGHAAFRLDGWEWPEGFKHYLTDHNIRPTPDFESFILRNSQMD